MSEDIKLGGILKRARERMGWTQQYVADKIEVSRGTYHRWEHNFMRPSAFYHPQIIDVLGLNEKEAGAFYHPMGQALPILDPPIIDNEPLIINNLPFQLNAFLTGREEYEDSLHYQAAQETPEIFYVPFLRNPFFTGREPYLEQLRQFLQADGKVGIYGLGGIGKTQIALEYAYRSHPDVYRTVLWVSGADTATLQATFASLTEPLKLPVRGAQKRRIEAVMDWLNEHSNWLLILDNADDLPIVAPFLPSKPLGHIVLTTRWQFPDKFAKPLAIAAMETEEGLHFLLRRARIEHTNADIREAGPQLVKELGGHALALEQAGAYIQETGISFVSYLTLYEKNRRSLLSQYGALDKRYSEHPLMVAATFLSTLEKAQELDPMGEDILRFCAFLRPDAIPEELFERDESFKQNRMAFNKGMASLLQYSLIMHNRQGRTLSLHRLMQVVIIEAISPGLRKQWRDRVVQALKATYSSVDFSWRHYKLLLLQLSACSAWSENELTPTVEVARLFYGAGISLDVLEVSPEAVTLQLRALTIFEQLLGADHPDAVSARYQLAMLYFKHGKYKQEEPLCLQAIAISERLGEHRDTAHWMVTLSHSYHMQGKYKQEEQLLVQALSILEKLLGTEHPEVAESMEQLASYYMRQGKFEQAEALYRRAIAIIENHLDTKFRCIAFLIRMLAFSLYEQGKDEQLDALYERVPRIYEQLEATHPEIQAGLSHLNSRTLARSFAVMRSLSLTQLAGKHYYEHRAKLLAIALEIQELRGIYTGFLCSIGRDAEAAALEVNDGPLV